MNNKLFTLLLSVISLSFFQNRIHAAANASSANPATRRISTNALMMDAFGYLGGNHKAFTALSLAGLDTNLGLHELPPEAIAQYQERFKDPRLYKQLILYLNEQGSQLRLYQNAQIPTLKFPESITNQELCAAVESINETCGQLIQAIDLSYCRNITEQTILILIQACPQLQNLNLEGTQITDTGITALAACPQLQELNLSFCYNITDAGITALAQACPQLQSLGLSGGLNITDTGITALAACTQLQSLDLSHCCDITDAGITALAQRCPQLQKLNLTYCSNISDAAITALAACTQLQSLDLFGCIRITDAAITALAACQRLQSLDLSGGRNITDAAITALAQGCPNLQKLILYRCNQITNASLTAFHAYRAANGLPIINTTYFNCS